MTSPTKHPHNKLQAFTPEDAIPPNVFYQCQRCGNCCRWPGDVKITPAETTAIARHLNMDEDAFIQKHTRLATNRQGLSLLERENGECSFLDGINCTLQEVKPSQCKGFPNQWNFPGWKNECEAIPLPKSPSS